jgi:two-component system CheB/CheR fusion protein
MTRIVGLGASAGGLEALTQFLAHVPPASGLAYVVVQHLDPTQETMLAALLQRATTMPVCEAMEAMPVASDAVYVIPPGTELSVVNGVLHLAPPAQPRGLRLPIDVLFVSLARQQGYRAIGVVLSGMGADGTHGLQAIKAQGGLTLAQQPESARFDSMPKSAIAADCVDLVAPPAELAQCIMRVLAAEPPERVVPGPADGSAPAATPLAPLDPGAESLPAILELLRAHCKHDLAQYKPSTLRRRIERRMGVHGLATMAFYLSFLQENLHERDLLFKEMLIGVTSFFRDPDVWRDVKETVLPSLIAGRDPGSRLRAWVAGCSTGEEAYSLAILFREVFDSFPPQPLYSVQIFATDLSADAIAMARKGYYSRQIAADVAPERLARFFSVKGDGYVINNNIREMVLFAQHDVILDPPFTRLDLICCRNLLIYFDAALQRWLMPLFHYCLRAGGILVLGGAETVGNNQSLFEPVNPKSRIFRRNDFAVAARAMDFPVKRHLPLRTAAQELNVSEPTNSSVNLQPLADQLLLREFSPPAVFVNRQGDIVYVSGRTGKYLEPAAGNANWNIHAMIGERIRPQVGAAVRKTQETREPVVLRGLRLDGDASHTVDVTVQAVIVPKALDGLVMIAFRDVMPAGGGRTGKKKPVPGSADAGVAEELARSQEEVRALRQEMRATAEELQAANEELQSTNEELQSANEELTTSKEEGQSMNEELQTINNELQSKLDELALAQSDMQNLLNSTDIATLFLDDALNVRRFTEQVTRIVHLREGDIGRPLSDLASTLIYPQLHADAKETLRTLVFCEKQISTTDGNWYSVRIMPYRTLANVIQGVVITFIDITAAKELESRLRKA